jgi:CBS domain-containing protein
MTGDVDVRSGLTVADLMQTAVVTVAPEITLRGVAELLTREEVGAAVVRGREGPVGVVSERDVVRALAEGEDPDDARVGDVMTFELCSVEHTASVAEAAEAMAAAGFRHLAVTRAGAVVGVVSMRDLAVLAVTPR